MRKLPTQVPDAISRLLKTQTIPPPVWYLPTLAHPPIPLPPRQVKDQFRPSPSSRPPSAPLVPTQSHAQSSVAKASHQMKHYRSKKLKVPEIVFDEDKIRRQFFLDFPFEALRPVTLVEGRMVSEEGVYGEEWTQLKQRGEYPTVENTISYILNLHNHFHISLSSAYTRAVDQFVHLRALHEIATFAAEGEARFYGATYKKSAFQRFHDLETRQLQSNSSSSSLSSSANSISARRRPWSPEVPEAAKTKGKFTGGIEYATVWARKEEEGRRRAEAEEVVQQAVEKDRLELEERTKAKESQSSD